MPHPAWALASYDDGRSSKADPHRSRRNLQVSIPWPIRARGGIDSAVRREEITLSHRGRQKKPAWPRKIDGPIYEPSRRSLG